VELKFRERKGSFADDVRSIISNYNYQPFTIHNVFGDMDDRWLFMEPKALYNKVRYAVHYLHKAGELEYLRRERNTTVFRQLQEDKYVDYKG